MGRARGSENRTPGEQWRRLRRIMKKDRVQVEINTHSARVAR